MLWHVQGEALSRARKRVCMGGLVTALRIAIVEKALADASSVPCLHRLDHALNRYMLIAVACSLGLMRREEHTTRYFERIAVIKASTSSILASVSLVAGYLSMSALS